MQMTEHEIKESFLQAKAPLKQIAILADLNQCKKSDIRRVLIKQGIPEKDTHAANWKPGIPGKDPQAANRETGKAKKTEPFPQDALEKMALETGKEAELQMEERLRLAAEAGKTEEAVKEEKTEAAEAVKTEASVYLRKTAKKAKETEVKGAGRMDEAILYLRERQFAIAHEISRLREMQEHLEFAIQELECCGTVTKDE